MHKVVNFSLNLKQDQHILAFLAVLFLGLLPIVSIGQELTSPSDSTLITIERSDSSLAYIRADSISIDSSQNQKSAGDDIEHTIQYSSQDSMRFDVASSTMYLYGQAVVQYGPRKIEADYISINWGNSLVTAAHTIDSTENKVGIPKFDDNGDVYNADTIMYNFDNGRGYISGIETDQNEGHLSGQSSYKTEDNVIYVHNGEYCPCDDPEAATYFKAKRIKVVPNDKVYTGPGILYIEDIPTPLLLPFGMFPANNAKSSGILPPVPGNNPQRGFFIRDLGYYWAVNDYIGAKITGSYYSKGGGGLGVEVEYKKRYRYQGFTYLDFTQNVSDGDGFNRVDENNYKFRWVHNPISYTGKRFSADVNFATTNYNARNELNINDNLASNLNSNINYSTPIRAVKGLNLAIGLRHEQNNTTGKYNLTLPDISINQSRVQPFKSNKPGKKSEWRTFYETVAFAYKGNILNKITNDFDDNAKYGFNVADARPDTILPFEQPNINSIMSNANYGMSHSIPITAALKLGSVNMAPSFTYNENWHNVEQDYSYRASDSTVVVDTVGSFGRSYNWNTGVSFTTRMYGTYSYSGERQKKLRHVLIPTLGFSYSPELSDDEKRFQTVQVDESGTTRKVSRFQGNTFSTLGGSESATINFGLQNDIEMKYFALKDTSGKAKYLKLIENLAVSSNYNMVADSFNLANFSLGANTNVFKGISIRWLGNLDPYSYRADSTNASGEVIEQTRINDFAWNQKQGLGTFSRNQFSVNGSFSPASFKKKAQTNKGTEEELESIRKNPNYYVDFEIPWMFRFGYQVTYSKEGLKDATSKQYLTLGGELNISDYWKLAADLAYDFDQNKFVSPRLTIYRDLNCWEFNVFWVPFGSSQSYEFRINLKPAALKDLKLTRNRSIRDI